MSEYLRLDAELQKLESEIDAVSETPVKEFTRELRYQLESLLARHTALSADVEFARKRRA